MKSVNTLVGIALLGATLGITPAPAGAAQHSAFLVKVEVFPGYCHMQFPAIEENSIGGRPVLQDASTTDIIDFYGPCNYDPLGRDEVQEQRSEKAHEGDGDDDE